MAIVYLIAGLALLAFAGDGLVRGSVSIAQRLGIPPIVVGLTIVAFGTSAPELIVSLEAALRGAPGLALGNVIGSNITNTTIVLGLPAVIAALSLAEGGIRGSAIFMVAVSAFMMMEASDLMIDRWTGFRLVLLLILYLLFSARTAYLNRQIVVEEIEGAMLGLPAAIAFTVFGAIGLAVGGKLTTIGALGVAETFGLADSAVGLTIVALGTSLPELAASVAAAFRRQAGVAVGNIIGSNIFNILGILGITAMVVPLKVDPELASVDMWIMFLTSVTLLLVAYTTRRIGRWGGIGLTLIYCTYTFVALSHGAAG